MLSKDLCGLCWIDLGFLCWIHSSGQILPTAVHELLREQSWAGWVYVCFRLDFGLHFLCRTFFKMHWGFLKSNRQLFLKRFILDQNGSFFSQIGASVESERGRECERGLTIYRILAFVMESVISFGEFINQISNSSVLYINV